MKATKAHRRNADAGGDVIPMQIRVPRSLRARYRAACAVRGVSMTDDLVAHMRGASAAAGGAARPRKTAR